MRSFELVCAALLLGACSAENSSAGGAAASAGSDAANGGSAAAGGRVDSGSGGGVTTGGHAGTGGAVGTGGSGAAGGSPTVGPPGTWTDVTPAGADEGNYGLGVVVADPKRPSDLYIGGNIFHGLQKSTDYGLTWTQI